MNTANRLLLRRDSLRRQGTVAAVSVLALLLSGCARGMLDPQSSAAAQVANLWWIMLAISGGVLLLVLAIMGVALFRASTRDEPTEPRVGPEKAFVLAGGVVLPVAVFVLLMFLTVSTGIAISNVGSDPIEVHVSGRQWWWEIRYPQQGITTANELHVPVGQPVRLVLTSQDVIHSFWVPQLAGKRDLIPGRTNTLTIEAAKPGVYRGQCAEFCGLQHAKMGFLVIAEPPDQFQQWLADQQVPQGTAQQGLLLQGQQVFLGSSCVYCHTIAGTNATGQVGPDLTHFGSRRTIAAGTIPNNRGNLAGWILDPQSVKPGTQMPSTQLTGDELDALLAYLLSLE